MTTDYQEATRGLNVAKAIYMEIDVAPSDHMDEVNRVTKLCKSPEHPTVAAVIGGRPGAPDFESYIRKCALNPFVKGVRQVLHGSTPRGYCQSDEYVQSVRLLGELGLSFDLCMRPLELSDGVSLVDRCPDTRFIVDHCGNADPQAFMTAARRGTANGSHDPDAWRRDMAALAKRKHVICKISGVVARVPKDGWDADDLAIIVDFCLDQFGPDRVVFGSDWPVCLLGAELAVWVRTLKEIVNSRPKADQQKLFHDNAQRLYQV